MARKVLIGSAIVDKDIEMRNGQFGYAADYENLIVHAGVYPIYAYEDDLEKRDGRVELGWRNYIGFEGTLVSGTFGGKPGDHTPYHKMSEGYMLAGLFLEGHGCVLDPEWWAIRYELRPEWAIGIHDFVSDFDGKRCFVKYVVLKDGAELTYLD